MMKGFEWPEELPEDIQEIKNYNGVTVSFDFFDGVMARIVKGLTTNIRNNRKGYEGKFKHILLWGDFDDANLEKIVRKLKLDAEYYVEILEDPVEILSKNLGEIDTIVLIITDCTKLSNNEFALKRLNEGLVDFVRQGGRLVCTHDVIYRRTRNELLQNMFGCKITNFRQSNEVVYIKTEECRDSDVFTSLNDRFILHDAEICWGNIADDVDVFFKTEDDIPLVFAREYGSGICVYLNPGDFKERPPRSILKPEKEFVDLLRESIYLQY